MMNSVNILPFIGDPLSIPRLLGNPNSINIFFNCFDTTLVCKLLMTRTIEILSIRQPKS